MNGQIETDVVIIGAGPSGATLALTLGRHGINTVLVDQGHQPLPGVRAGGASQLILSIMRRLGVEDEIRRRAPIPPGWAADSVVTTGLCDRVLNLDKILEHRGAFHSRIKAVATPTVRQNIQSQLLEVVLREAIAEEPSVRTLYGYSFREGITQNDSGVYITVHNESGEKTTLHSNYVVGADGANSGVREALGIGIEGYRHFMTRYKVEFIAPSLGRLHGLGNHNSYAVVNEDIIADFFHQDAGRRWTLQVREVAPHAAHLVSDANALIRLAARGDVEIEWSSVTRWRANAFYATKQRAGRVFLIGDAAHATPPGALGLQQGIADGADLGWKLAARVQGWGGEQVLESFEAERLPISRRLVREVDVTGVHKLDDFAMYSGTERDAVILEDFASRALGQISRELAAHSYVYSQSPILPSLGSRPLLSGSPFAEIGKQIPHRWLPGGLAVIDVLGPRMTLLHGSAHDPSWATIVERSGLQVVADVALPDHVMAGLVGIPGGGAHAAILVRPDSHVAWLGLEAGDDSVLDLALGRTRQVAMAENHH